jgi:hypothetical protein
MSLKMDKAEREAFLAELHVGIISIEEPGRGPLTVPIWYGYEPGGDLWIVTERDSRKGRLPSDVERDVRPLAHRYLGAEFGDRYIESTGGADDRGNNVLVKMRPERWLTTDYSKEFALDDESAP